MKGRARSFVRRKYRTPAHLRAEGPPPPKAGEYAAKSQIGFGSDYEEGSSLNLNLDLCKEPSV
jgi:hypothetical protein